MKRLWMNTLLAVTFTGFTATAMADTALILKNGARQAQQNIAELQRQLGNVGSGGNNPGPTPGPGPSDPGSGCPWCSDSSRFENPNQAMSRLAEASASAVEASKHADQMLFTSGNQRHFHWGMACSHLGDARLLISRANFALGQPFVSAPVWVNKVRFTVNQIANTRNSAFCP